MVRTERLELSRVAPLGPKPSASTNFATSALAIIIINNGEKVKDALSAADKDAILELF